MTAAGFVAELILPGKVLSNTEINEHTGNWFVAFFDYQWKEDKNSVKVVVRKCTVEDPAEAGESSIAKMPLGWIQFAQFATKNMVKGSGCKEGSKKVEYNSEAERTKIYKGMKAPYYK